MNQGKSRRRMAFLNNGFSPLEETKNLRVRGDGSLKRQTNNEIEFHRPVPLPPIRRWTLRKEDGTTTELFPTKPTIDHMILYHEVLDEFNRRQGLLSDPENYAKEIYNGLGKDLTNLERVDLKTSYNHYDIYYDVTHIPGLRKKCEEDITFLESISVAFLRLIYPHFPHSVVVRMEFFRKIGGNVIGFSPNLPGSLPPPPTLNRSSADGVPSFGSLHCYLPMLREQDGVRLNISWADRPIESFVFRTNQHGPNGGHTWGQNESGTGPLLPRVD